MSNTDVMPPFTSKELYIMNGGQKHYIYLDGFGDVYNATTEEEAEWAKEIIENSLSKIAGEQNPATLRSAIENLAFHKYNDQVALLVSSIRGASPERQLAFASSLWNMNCNENDFEIAFEILLQYHAPCITDLFERPGNFKNHIAARLFLIRCLQGNDEYLFEKAHTILCIWAWSGLPQLRENSFLDRLQFNNKDFPASKACIQRLKEILTIIN